MLWFKSPDKTKIQILNWIIDLNQPLLWFESSSYLIQIKEACDLNHYDKGKTWFSHSFIGSNHPLEWFESSSHLIRIMEAVTMTEAKLDLSHLFIDSKNQNFKVNWSLWLNKKLVWYESCIHVFLDPSVWIINLNHFA